MTERDLTTGLMKFIALRYPGAVVIKHHGSRFSRAGQPDLSVSVNGQTVWFEIKYVRRGGHLLKELSMLQKLTCYRLAMATEGKCFVLAYHEHPKKTELCVMATHDLAKSLATHEGLDHAIVRRILDVAA